MTHREVLEAMSGLLLAMFVAILSSTVVSTALPRIIGDLGGSQSSYTWVVTSTLLALTVSTPIWGKLADLFDRKLLVQTGLVIFVIGSILASLAHSTSWLIGCRVVQGVGIGGLTALVQVILSDLVSPRERGRYSGYLGAVFGVGTVVGPLLGGVVTDGLGWRWCFGIGVPFAVAAFVVLQRTLHIPRRRREVRIDVLGATLIAAGVSSLLIWVSLAGQSYAWGSWQTAALVAAGLGFLLAGRAGGAPGARADRSAAPVRRPHGRARGDRQRRRRHRDVRHDRLPHASTCRSRAGCRPTESGLLTIPMVFGLFCASLDGRADRQPHRPLQALDGARRDAADGRPGADGHDRRDDQPDRARRLHARRRRRPRDADAEPRPGRAEHRGRSATWAPAAR